MKRLLILLTACLVIIGCSKTPQEKAEKAVQTFLKENLRNPETYEAINFSEVDTIFQADTLKEKRDNLNIWYSNLLEIQKSDSMMASFYRNYNLENYQDYLSDYKIITERIDSIKLIIKGINDIVDSNKVKENIVRYRITHEYQHKGLDEELVNLNIEFILNSDFTIDLKKIKKGINGQANFDIKILSKDGGIHYIEFVIDPKFDDQLINSDGITELHVKAGHHYITWTSSNRNGLGVLTNPETFRREIILEDSENAFTFFVIHGKSFWKYKNIEAAEKDNYYIEYILKD